MKRDDIMKTNKIISVLLCLILVFTSLCGCSVKESELNSDEKRFVLEVVYEDGNTEETELASTEKYVGDALVKEGIIEGENGKYGMYIKSVNGILADFEKTGTYWAFYINDEYATTGVDKAVIEEGAKYSLKVEK